MIESNILGIDNGAALLILIYGIVIPAFAYYKTRKAK